MLTDDEIGRIDAYTDTQIDFARAIEAKVREADEALLRQSLNFLYRVSHWAEGKPDLHDMKTALKARLGETK